MVSGRNGNRNITVAFVIYIFDCGIVSAYIKRSARSRRTCAFYGHIFNGYVFRTNFGIVNVKRGVLFTQTGNSYAAFYGSGVVDGVALGYNYGCALFV